MTPLRMGSISACLAVLAVLHAGTPADSFDFGDVGKAAASLTGSSTTAGGAGALITAATVKYLSGSEKLADATGDTVAAKQYAEMRKKAERGDSVDLSQVSSKMEKIAKNESALRKADTSKVNDAAIDVGTATLIQTKAVAAMKDNPGALAANPVGAAGLLKAGPANLKSMLSVQQALFSYLRARGEDPEADAKKAAEELEKG